MNRREFLLSAAGGVLAVPVLSPATETEVWEGVPPHGDEQHLWILGWQRTHGAVVLKEQDATRAILGGGAVREVVAEYRLRATRDNETPPGWLEVCRLREKVGDLQPGERVTPLLMYLSRQRPDTIRLVAYVVRT